MRLRHKLNEIENPMFYSVHRSCIKTEKKNETYNI